LKKGVKFAQVLYDFHAESPSEINLVKGTLIKILNDENNEWWEGTFEDNSGFFPASYVKIEEKYLHMNPKQKASVTYDYYADSENEITIKKGDIVYLHESDPDQEWWEANLNGNRGFIPKHYISVVKPVPKTSSLDRVKRSGEITSPEEVEVAQEEDYKGSKSKKKKKILKHTKKKSSITKESLENDIDQELKKNNQLKEKIADLVGKLDDLESLNVEDIQKKLEIEKTQNTKLNSDIKDLNAKIKDLNTKAKTAQNELNNIQSKINNEKDLLQEKENQKSSIRIQIKFQRENKELLIKNKTIINR